MAVCLSDWLDVCLSSSNGVGGGCVVGLENRHTQLKSFSRLDDFRLHFGFGQTLRRKTKCRESLVKMSFLYAPACLCVNRTGVISLTMLRVFKVTLWLFPTKQWDQLKQCELSHWARPGSLSAEASFLNYFFRAAKHVCQTCLFLVFVCVNGKYIVRPRSLAKRRMTGQLAARVIEAAHSNGPANGCRILSDLLSI